MEVEATTMVPWKRMDLTTTMVLWIGSDDGCHFFTKVTKWRDEPAKGGKEAVAIQGMDEIPTIGLLQFNEGNITSVL
jgi:hypothetical protein